MVMSQFISTDIEAENQIKDNRLLKNVQIAADAEAQLLFELLALDSIGKASFDVTASGNNEQTQLSVELPLRSAAPPITETGNGLVTAEKTRRVHIPFKPNTEFFRLFFDCIPFSGNWVRGWTTLSDQVSLWVS